MEATLGIINMTLDSASGANLIRICVMSLGKRGIGLALF
jgi:hypothetical protein